MKNLFRFVLIVSIMFFGLIRAQSPAELGRLISKDTEFIQFAEKMKRYSEVPKDVKEVKRISSLKEVNEEDRLSLMKALGFSSLDEAYNFDIQNISSVSNLNSKFGLDQLSPFVLEETISIALDLVYQQVDGANCDKKFKNCKIKASATYYASVAGCVGLGVGVGTLSFWCAGCAGVGLGAVCVSAAVAYFSASYDDCVIDYNECKN